MILNKWWPKATIFQKTRQSRDDRSKATTKNTKQRKRCVIKEMMASRRPGEAKTTGAKPQQRAQSKGKIVLLNKWWRKATIFKKTRQSQDDRSKATTKNTKLRKRSVIN